MRLFGARTLILRRLNKVTAIKNGDSLVFEQVFREYHSKIYFYILGKTRSAYLAEEVVQLTFIKLWNFRSSLNDEYTLSTQLFRIATTTLIDLLRKESNNRALVTALLQEKHPVASDPNRLLTDKELLKKARDVIDRMPEMQRKTFQLSRIEGLSYKEIAEKLSISVKTVEVHIARALKKIRKQIPLTGLLWLFYFLSSKGQ